MRWSKGIGLLFIFSVLFSTDLIAQDSLSKLPDLAHLESLPSSKIIETQASGHFSSRQGDNGWFYLDSSGRALKYFEANTQSECGAEPCWKGEESYLVLKEYGGNPGTRSDAVRRWVAPQDGNIVVSGKVLDTSTTCGDGAIAKIYRSSPSIAPSLIWSQSLNNLSTVYFFDLPRPGETWPIKKDEYIDFVITRGTSPTNNNWCDWTYFDPKIILTPSNVVEEKFDLAVSKFGSGGGMITSFPEGIMCGDRCQLSLRKDSEVSLSAKESSGSLFAGWSGACIGMNECKVKMQSALSVQAEFKRTLPQSFCVDCLQLKVERPLRAAYRENGCAYGPGSQIDDGPVTIIPYKGKLLGLMSSQNSRVVEGKDLDTLFQNESKLATVALARSGTQPSLNPTCGGANDPAGVPNAIDSSGAWINGAWVDPNNPDLIRIWYHGETQSNYCREHSHWSVGYAESYDGKSFTKKGWSTETQWPNNFVLRAKWPPKPSAQCPSSGGGTCMVQGVGNHSVLLFGDYYYIYNQDASLYGGLTIARAPASSGGIPGSWKRFNNNSFSTEGIDGPATPTFDVTGSWMPAFSSSVLKPFNKVVLIGNGGAQTQPAFMRMFFSSNGYSEWSPLKEPLLIADAGWSESNRELVWFISTYAQDGSREWDNMFNLFYSYRPPYENGADGCGPRSIVQRKVFVDHLSVPSDNPQVKVALSRYYSLRGDNWATTQAVGPEYRFQWDLGYLATVRKPGMSELFDCWDQQLNDHYSDVGSCSRGGVKLRSSGYFWSTQKPGTHPLERCRSESNGKRNHYLSHVGGCAYDHVPTDGVIGYFFD